MGNLLDLVILGGLLAALGYGYFINRRLRGLMAAMEALQPTVAAFASAVDRSEGSVVRLRSAAEALAARSAPAPERRAADPRPAAEPRPAAVAKVRVKEDLVRSFFDRAGGRSA